MCEFLSLLITNLFSEIRLYKFNVLTSINIKTYQFILKR